MNPRQFPINGAFPVFSAGFVLGSLITWAVNLADSQSASPPAAAQWSAGAQLLVPIASQPTITKRWRILGYTINALGAMQLGVRTAGAIPNNPGPYGALGKLYGGLVAGGYQPAGYSAFTGLPQDASNISLIWDGSQDKALQQFPPVSGIGVPNQISSGSPLQATQNLASPISLDPSGQISIGLWLTPSLVYALNALVIAAATYTILVETDNA